MGSQKLDITERLTLSLYQNKQLRYDIQRNDLHKGEKNRGLRFPSSKKLYKLFWFLIVFFKMSNIRTTTLSGKQEKFTWDAKCITMLLRKMSEQKLLLRN